jgi:hypothetical protein
VVRGTWDEDNIRLMVNGSGLRVHGLTLSPLPLTRLLAVAVRKVFSYRFSPDLAIERFADEAILFVAARDELITINLAAADLFEAAVAAFADCSFGLSEAMVWFATTYDLAAGEVDLKLRPLLVFAVRHGIVVRQ